MTALFVSPKYVKRKSIIDGELDADKLIQFIETAQDIHIQNYLGTNLYKKLQLLIVNNTINDAGNADYKVLLEDFIKPMLAWYTQSEYIPFAAYTIGNGGIYKHRSDNSDSIDYSEVSGLTTRANDKAMFYTNRFLDYMNFNSSLYPEYIATTQAMYPDRESKNISWVL
jgi:hypothetical protein